jgi:hypothetical protein
VLGAQSLDAEADPFGMTTRKGKDRANANPLVRIGFRCLQDFKTEAPAGTGVLFVSVSILENRGGELCHLWAEFIFGVRDLFCCR